MKKQEKDEIVELFEELKKGNKEKFGEIYNKYQKIIYGIAFSILKNKEDAEDIVQSVFVKLYSLEKSKLPTSNALSWMYTLTKNEALQFLRKKKNSIELKNIYELEDDNSEINEFIDEENFNRIISKLSPKEKEIISLKIISDMSFEQISKLLGEKTGTIKWRYYKAIYNLKALFSNLLMSIVAFAIGFASLKQKKLISPIDSQQNNINNQVNQSQNIFEEEGSVQNSELQDIYEENDETKSELQDNNRQSEDLKDSIKTENVINVDSTAERYTNYVGNSFLGVSAIFFIIVAVIIFRNYQLKLRKKSSK